MFKTQNRKRQTMELNQYLKKHRLRIFLKTDRSHQAIDSGSSINSNQETYKENHIGKCWLKNQR